MKTWNSQLKDFPIYLEGVRVFEPAAYLQHKKTNQSKINVGE